MRKILKLLAVVLIVLGFVVAASVVHLFVRNQWKQRALLARLKQKFTGWVLIPLQIKVKVKGNAEKAPRALVVSNHMSYLDIFILSSLYPTSYVTSVEMRDTPVLGHLCRLGACVFVERRNKFNIQNEIREITEALERNLTVTIFPEATSTNGDEILRFRRPLYNAAIFAKSPVQPLCINYLRINGEAVTKETRDLACWYGDMNFAAHLLKFVGLSSFEVEVNFLDPIYEPHQDLDSLVALSHERVKQAYRGFVSITNESQNETSLAVVEESPAQL